MSTMYTGSDPHNSMSAQQEPANKAQRLNRQYQPVQIHTAKKVAAPYNPLHPLKNDPTERATVCYTSTGAAIFPLTDYARELTETRRERNTRIKIKKPKAAGRPLRRSDSTARSVEVLCSGLCLGIIEMFRGYRTLRQFQQWLSPECYASLQQQGQQLCAKTGRIRRTVAAHIIRSRAQLVDGPSGGYEVTLVVHNGVGVHAMAMRVIERYASWQITAVEYH